MGKSLNFSPASTFRFLVPRNCSNYFLAIESFFREKIVRLRLRKTYKSVKMCMQDNSHEFYFFMYFILTHPSSSLKEKHREFSTHRNETFSLFTVFPYMWLCSCRKNIYLYFLALFHKHESRNLKIKILKKYYSYLLQFELLAAVTMPSYNLLCSL